MLFKSILFLLLLCVSSQADYSVELRDSQDIYPIGKGVLFLEDKEGLFGIHNLTEMDSKFQVSLSNDLNFGFTGSVYWFKIPVKNFSEDPQKQWWLDIDYTLLDDIIIYQDKAGELSSLMHSGDQQSFDDRPIKWRSYSSVLDTSSPSILYIRVDTQSSMQIPLTIYSSSKIVSVKQAETLFSGFFYGIVMLVIFYNVFLFYIWNDKNYLYYIFFVSSFMLWQLSVDGLGHQYIWGNIQWLREKGSLVFIGLTIFNALLFTRSFLHLDTYAKRLSTLLFFLQVFVFTLIVSTVFLSYALVIQILTWLILPIAFLLLYAGVTALGHKYQYARFYVVGWTLFLGASLLLALNKLGYIGGYEYIKYFQQIGSIAEIMFFSLALAERINLLRRKNIKTLSRLNSRLQSEVHEKISQIRKKDELLLQQSRLASMGEMLENISHQWKQPLHKLSLVIQNHYFKSKLEGVDKEDLESFNKQSTTLLNYMSNTVDDFRNFFNPEKEKTVFDLGDSIEKTLGIIGSSMKEHDIAINIHTSATHNIVGYPREFSQVLLNLFSNSRDAFLEKDIENKKIDIRVSEHKDSLNIVFLDNAGGIPLDILPKIFDPYFTTKGFKEGSGIGLYMSKMIIENSMQGIFHVKNNAGGAEFSISLAKVL